MSGDARYFNNIERRAFTKFVFQEGKEPKKIHVILKETLWEHAPSHDTVKSWVTQIKSGDFSTCDGPCHGRPRTVTTPEIIDQIHELILENKLENFSLRFFFGGRTRTNFSSLIIFQRAKLPTRSITHLYRCN
jgi:transposase